MPHPQRVSVSGSDSATTLVVPLTGDLRPRVVRLYTVGSTRPAITATPGPARIKIAWSTLPAMTGVQVSGYSIYRRAPGGSMIYRARVSNGAVAFTDYSIRTGSTYSYEVHPNFYGGGTGVFTPAVAAVAWPKYSAGMYHRLASPVRFVSGHKVKAGHPYSLKVLGHHGVPSSHVSAVVLEVSAAKPSATTNVTVYPSGSHRPSASDLYVVHGGTRTNFAITKIGSGGRIVVSTSHGSTPVSVDVSGYYSASGLSSKYGTGAALHSYIDRATVLDTKRERLGALPSGYYANTPINFPASIDGHVTSLLVQITAYGSKGSGTVTAYATNGHVPATTTLSYGPNTTASNTALVSIGRYFTKSGRSYPSVSLLNRGKKSVQLIVTIMGFYDDDTLIGGQRCTPTGAVHLYAHKMHTGVASIDPRSHAGARTTAMNLKISGAGASRTTSVKLWPRGLRGIGAPAHGQLFVTAHQSVTSSTVQPVGTGDRYYVRNATGAMKVNIWSFGRFDYYPITSARTYASTNASGPTDPATVTAPTGVPAALRYVRQR